MSGTGLEKGCVIWICETKEKKRFSVRPVGTFEERRKLFLKAKSFIGKFLTVKYQELSDYNIPVFGVGIGIRDYE